MEFRRFNQYSVFTRCLYQLALALEVYSSEESLLQHPLAGVRHPIALGQWDAPMFCPALKKQEHIEVTQSPLDLRQIVYNYHEGEDLFVLPTVDNPSMDGFTKQRCYSSLDADEEDYCVYANPDFGEGRGMVLYIRPSYFRAKLDSFTIFKTGSNLLTDKERAEFPYKLVHMPSKGGLGAIADRKIYAGEPIVVDYSLVVIFANLDNIELEKWAERLKYMVDLLPFKGRELFAKQHGVGHDVMSWVVSAFQRNIFASPQDNDESGGCAFAPEPAYLNHDCRPNVGYRFNNETLQVDMHALRDIAPDEELTISYINLFHPREKRQQHLRETYGFKCGCSQCSLGPDESNASDQRLELIRDLYERLSDWDVEPAPSPEAAEELIKLFEMDRLHASMEEPHTIAALVYNSLGMTHKARKHAATAISYGIHIHDETWLETSPHLPLIYDPEHHWSYHLQKKLASKEKNLDEGDIDD